MLRYVMAFYFFAFHGLFSFHARMKKVSLIECRSFPGKDPFVRAFYPDDESLIFESSVKKNNPNATWKESFFCMPSHSSTIRFACHDHRGGNSVFVGNVVVDLSVDGVKTVELLKAALVFEVETVKQGKNMLSVHITSVRGCEGPLLCRGVYASSVIAEFEISAFPTFTFEPIGGHAGFEVSLWRRGEPSPVASALVDLRVGGRQEIQCDGCVMPISLIVDVLNPSSPSWRPSGATICVSQLVTNVPVDRWQVRTDDGLSSWLHPQDYWCFNSQSKNLTLEILTSDGHGVVNLELGEALESTPNNFSVARGVLRDGIDGYIEWSWSSQPEWSLGKPTSTDTDSAGARDRREKECRLSLKVLGIVAFSPGTLTITCGSSVTAKIGHAKQGFSALSKSLHATVAPPMHHALFSLSLDSKGEFFGQLSPFHLPNEGRRWVTLERGGDVGGFVEVEWLSIFESHSNVDCEDLNVVSEIEVVEAQALSSSDLGGTCNAFCVLQALPVSDACRLCSPIVKSSVNPRWSWNVSLTLKATSGIVVNVLDADSTGDEFLGFLSLPANSFFWKCETGDCWLPLADQPTGQLERHCGALHLRWNHQKGVLPKPSGTYTQAVASGECEILFDNIEIGGMAVSSLRVGEQVFFATSSALVSSAQAQSLVQGGVIPIEVVSASGDLFSGSVVLSKLTVKRKLFHIAITSLTAQPLVMVSEIQLLWKAKIAQKWKRNLDGKIPLDIVVRQLRLDDPIEGDAVMTVAHTDGPSITVPLLEGLEGVCEILKTFSLTANDDTISILVANSKGSDIGCTEILPLSEFSDRVGCQWFAIKNDTTITGAIEVEYHHSLAPVSDPEVSDGTRNFVTIEVVQIRGLWPLSHPDQPTLPRAQVGLRIGDHSFSTQRAPPSLCPVLHEGHVFSLSDDDLNDDLRVSVIDTGTLSMIGQGVVKVLELLQKPLVTKWISVQGISKQHCEVLVACSSTYSTNVQLPQNATVDNTCNVVVVESASNLLQSKYNGTLRDVCNIVARCVLWGPARQVILEDKSTQAVPNSLNPSWEARLCSLQDDCTIQLLVIDTADNDAFLGSVVLQPSQISQQASSFRLINCDLDGKPNANLGAFLKANQGASLGSITVSRSNAVDSHEATSWLLVDFFPQVLRCIVPLDLHGATLRLSWGVPLKHFQFELTGNSQNPTVTPSTCRMCVANPCVVKAVICDASHREVAHASMVVSHDEHRNSSLDDEMWSTFHAASDQAPRDPVANLYSLFKVISSGEDDNMVERTTLLHLRGISGLVTSHGSHSPTVLFFRTVSQSGGTVYETRSFRPPDRSKQGSYRTLDGGSFAIPVATPVCALELWSKEVRSGRLTLLAQSTVALEGDDDSCFWIPFRQLSSPAGVLTRQSPELSQVIAAVKATRETHSRWVTGAALTFLRLCVASGDVGDNALNNLVVEVDVHCRDHSSVVSKSLKVIYPRDGATESSSFGTLMQSLTLPSNVVAVTSMRIFHELLSGEKLLLGQAPSLTGSAGAALPWTMSSIATYTIPLLQGDGVPTRYSLVVTNALGASNSDVDARSVVGVTMHAESVTLNSFDGDGAISVRLSFGSAGKAALPVVIPLRRVSSQHFVPVNTDGIDESFTKKAFARGTMTCELVENTTIVGSVTVRSDVFQNASGCAELTFTSGQRTVGTVQWRYSLRLHEVQKKPRKKPSVHNQSLQQMPSRGASSSAAPIVLQLVGVSAGDINDSCDVVVHMQRASSDETLCVSRFEVREPLSRSLETDEAIGGKMTTYGRFQLKSSTDKSEVRLSLWRTMSRQSELVLCGCAAVRRDSIEQSISATSRGSPGIFNVALMHNGTQEGTARLRAFDHVAFDTHVLRRMCVLVKCVSATGLSHGQRIVVEYNDDNGTVKQERIFLDESSMVSVGPFRSVREATMNIFVENPIAIGLQHLPSASPQKSSSHTIDIAQRLTSQIVDSQLPPVLNVSFTLPMGGEMSSPSVVALAMQLFVSCGDDVISELSHRRTSQHRASGPRASPLLKHQRSVTPLHEQCDNAIATSSSLAQLASGAPSDFAVLEVPTLAQTRPAEKVVVWKDLAVFVGGCTSTPSEGRDLHMFDAASLIWKSYSQPVLSDQHLVKGHGRENSAFVAHRGCAVVRCGDGLLVDGGFGPGGLDPSLSQFTGRYESVRSVYQISSASGASTKQYEAVTDGYIDQTSVCSLKDARAHHRGWRVLRTRGAGKSPRSDHTLVRVEESLVIAFGGFTVQILERVMPFGSTEAAIGDPALQVGDERFSYLNSILTVDGDSAQLSGFDQRRQAGRGIVRNESEHAPHLQRRSKQCRTYEAQENLCNDLRCLNLDTLEWSLLQPMIPGDEGDDEGIHRGYTSTTRSHANSSIPSLLDGSILPSKSFERIALPQPSAGHIAEFIPQSRCMVVFGGLQQSSSNSDSCLVASADLSILKVDALQWFSCKRRAVPGEWPSARFGHSSTLMPNHDILIFGGAARTELPHDVGALPPHELLWRLSLADDAHTFERILLPNTVPITSRFQAAICFIPTEEGTNMSTYSEGTLVIGSGLLLTGMISDTSTTSQHKTTPSSINRFASLRHRSMVEDVKGVPTRPLALMMSLANKPVSL